MSAFKAPFDDLPRPGAAPAGDMENGGVEDHAVGASRSAPAPLPPPAFSVASVEQQGALDLRRSGAMPPTSRRHSTDPPYKRPRTEALPRNDDMVADGPGTAIPSRGDEKAVFAQRQTPSPRYIPAAQDERLPKARGISAAPVWRQTTSRDELVSGDGPRAEATFSRQERHRHSATPPGGGGTPLPAGTAPLSPAVWPGPSATHPTAAVRGPSHSPSLAQNAAHDPTQVFDFEAPPLVADALDSGRTQSRHVPEFKDPSPHSLGTPPSNPAQVPDIGPGMQLLATGRHSGPATSDQLRRRPESPRVAMCASASLSPSAAPPGTVSSAAFPSPDVRLPAAPPVAADDFALPKPVRGGDRGLPSDRHPRLPPSDNVPRPVGAAANKYVATGHYARSEHEAGADESGLRCAEPRMPEPEPQQRMLPAEGSMMPQSMFPHAGSACEGDSDVGSGQGGEFRAMASANVADRGMLEVRQKTRPPVPARSHFMDPKVDDYEAGNGSHRPEVIRGPQSRQFMDRGPAVGQDPNPWHGKAEVGIPPTVSAVTSAHQNQSRDNRPGRVERTVRTSPSSVSPLADAHYGSGHRRNGSTPQQSGSASMRSAVVDMMSMSRRDGASSGLAPLHPEDEKFIRLQQQCYEMSAEIARQEETLALHKEYLREQTAKIEMRARAERAKGRVDVGVGDVVALDHSKMDAGGVVGSKRRYGAPKEMDLEDGRRQESMYYRLEEQDRSTVALKDMRFSHGQADIGGLHGRQGSMVGRDPATQGAKSYTAKHGEESMSQGQSEGPDLEKDGGSVKCPECNQLLRNTVTLQNHIRVVHQKCGEHKCETCDAMFMWKSTLRNHVRLVHEKVRPFECDRGSCSQKFRWKSHLKEHIDVVHDKRERFSCKKCGKRFGRKNNCMKHIKRCQGPHVNGEGIDEDVTDDE